MRKLTKRERVMLFALAIIAIVAGGIYFIVMPTAKMADELELEINSSKASYSEMRAAVAAMPETERQIAEASAALEKAENKLYEYLPNEEIDAMLTRMLQSHGLKPLEMQIGAAEYLPVPAYGEEAEETSAEGEEQTTLLCNTITLTTMGEFEDFKAFIDSAARNRALAVTSFATETLDTGEDEGTIGPFKKGEVHYTVTLTIYFR